MTSAREQLLTITPATADRDIATMIAETMVEIERLPYRFSINHNVGPPEFKACPLAYDWVLKKRVGIETKNKTVAKAWIISALVRGYSVSRHATFAGRSDEDYTLDIARARLRARIHQQPKGSDDDDIPF